MSHVPHQGFADIAGSRADLTRSTSGLGHWLRCEALSQTEFATVLQQNCDHDRLGDGARLVTYCSRKKQIKLCAFLL